MLKMDMAVHLMANALIHKQKSGHEIKYRRLRIMVLLKAAGDKLSLHAEMRFNVTVFPSSFYILGGPFST